MDLKYRHIRYGGAVEDFVAIQSPVICQRVQSLSLDLLNFKPLSLLPLPDQKRSDHSPSESCCSSHPKSKEQSSPAHLSSLESLSICIDSIHYYHNFITHCGRYARQTWLAVPHSLQVLCLDIPLEAYRDGIFPNHLTISNLQELALHLWAGFRTTDYEAILSQHVAPLINRHADSLRSLKVSFDEHYPTFIFYKSQPLFQHLGKFPLLSSFGVRITLASPAQTDLSGLEQFLANHSSTIKDLILELPHSSQIRVVWNPFFKSYPLRERANSNLLMFNSYYLFSMPLFDPNYITFPLLETLDFSVFFSDRQSFPIGNFLSWAVSSPWSQTLTTLRLTFNDLSPHPGSKFFKLLSPEVFPSLRYLALYLHEITHANQLSRIAGHLTFLEGLELNFTYFRLYTDDFGYDPSNAVQDNSDSDAAVMLESHPQSALADTPRRSNLKHLSLKRSNMRDVRMNVSRATRELIIRIFPTVVLFNGMKPAQFVDKLNFDWPVERRDINHWMMFHDQPGLWP